MASQSSRDNGEDIPPALIDTLAEWFGHNARDLPWRHDQTPYRVWISEVMLQQTRVEAVREYFRRFVKRFPNVRALARASEDDVLAAWSGLGYYRRARMLHAAAKQIVVRHGGRFPRDAKAIADLPGVGRYTAGAIRSIALNEPAPIVDGNIERVFARLHAVSDLMKSPAARRRVWDWALAWVARSAAQGHAPREANQALMELGATVCTPRAPRCTACPARSHCKAGRKGNAEAFPVAAPRATVREVDLLFVLLRDEGDRAWLVRREAGTPPSLLPDGLWELPHVPWSGTAPERALRQLAGALGCELTIDGPPVSRRHAIMNARITMTVMAVRAVGEPRWQHGPSSWFDAAQAAAAPMASATRKLLGAASRRVTSLL